MVEVRFVGIPNVVGVKCTLDGVVKYTAGIGIVSFYGISQGDHTYSVEPPDGMVFVSGEDTFHRPLGESGTTTIEFYPAGLPWPEDLPWALGFTFEVEVVKKPVTMALDIYPTSGAPPYDAMITAVLRANGVALVGKYVSIYKNGSLFTSGNTDAGGKIERTDTVTAESSYYASFAGDSEYEGGVSPTITATIEAVVEPPEFKFAAYTPFLDTREIFPVGAPWPSVTKRYQVGDSVYVHYAVKNIARVGVGGAVITVRDLDTGAVITTWAVPELRPNERFKTTGSGAYVGKMPSKEWRLEFKVEP